MASQVLERGLTITNPLHLYRSLLTLKRIEPDPAQHRLCLKLEEIYRSLKDYSPKIEYAARLREISKTIEKTEQPISRRISLWKQPNTQSKALVRSLTSYEGALEIQSPRGLLLHGEVGTGKSMLIDLLADSLPTSKKRRWHFNTFMLEVLAQIEKLRIKRVGLVGDSELEQETPLLVIARDMVVESPILFLDEFQLPDKAASKILSHLFTCFFQLGGCLIATSNRMPDDLWKAAGIEYAPPPPTSSFTTFASSFFGRNNQSIERPQKTDFAKFLDVLNARCDTWEMENTQDWRRREFMANGSSASRKLLPKYYLVNSPQTFETEIARITGHKSFKDIPWEIKTIRIYGRDVVVPRCLNGITMWTFHELCFARLGPADYVSLASTFHTFIVQDVPVLNLLQRSEARRFITFLDAAYEARCRLLCSAEAGPDNIFFPEAEKENESNENAMLPETMSEVYQDLTAPFRPNISSYAASASEPDYAPQPLPSIRPGTAANPDIRSILADEDADFGPTYGAGRSSGHDSQQARLSWLNRTTTEPPIDNKTSPNFSKSGIFTGEDERFAYKRAQSRLFQICGEAWWARDQNLWNPVRSRAWEKDANSVVQAIEQDVQTAQDTGEVFRHGASPFRVAVDPPPRFSEQNIWSLGLWGKRAGLWGKGVDKFDEDRPARDNEAMKKS